jgi:hypothetical protein
LRDQRGIDRTEPLPRSRQQRIDQRRGDDRSLFGKAQIVNPLSAQQPGVEDVEPLEPQPRQRVLGLALDPHVERLAARIGPRGADQHHVGHACIARSLRGGEHKIVIDRAERCFIAPGLLPRCPQCTDQRAGAHGFEHLAPLGRLGDEHFHPRAGRQRCLAPGDADNPRLIAKAGDFDHLAADQPGRPDQRNAHRACALPEIRH